MVSYGNETVMYGRSLNMHDPRFVTYMKPSNGQAIKLIKMTHTYF